MTEKESRKIKSVRFREGSSLGSGIFKCSSCGAPYYRHVYQSGVIAYAHNRAKTEWQNCKQKPVYVPIEFVDLFLKECFYEEFLDTQAVQRFLDAKKIDIYKDKEELDRQKEKLVKEIEEIDDEKKRLMVLVQKGLSTIDELEDQFKEINQRIKEKQKIIEEIGRKLLSENSEFNRLLDLIGQGYLDRFDESDVDGSRMILMEVIKKAEFKGDEIHLEFWSGKKHIGKKR